VFRDTVSFVLQQVRRQKSITVCKANILKSCYPNSVSLDSLFEEICSEDYYFGGPIILTLLSVYALIVLKFVGAFFSAFSFHPMRSEHWSK
jgi:hypothetical protein